MTRPTKDELKARLKQLDGPLTEAIADREDALIERAELEADLREVEWRTGPSARHHSMARQAYDKARTIYLNGALAKIQTRLEAADREVRKTMQEIDAIKEALAVSITPEPVIPPRTPADDQMDLIKRSLNTLLGGL